MSVIRYSKEHEWVRVEGDEAVIGITDFAQNQLGDIVYVELPEPGKAVAQGKEIAVVESVKAASEVYAPLTGDITAVNTVLADEPALVNSEPLGGGWFMRIRMANPKELDGLMDEAAYLAFVAGLG